MRIEAEPGKGELGHVGLADDDGAGGTQPGDDRGIFLGRQRVTQHSRSCPGRLAGNVEQILDRDRQPGQRAAAASGLARAIAGGGIRSRPIGIKPGEDAVAFAVRCLRMAQRRIDQRRAGGFAGGEPARDVVERDHLSAKAPQVRRRMLSTGAGPLRMPSQRLTPSLSISNRSKTRPMV